MNELHLAIPIVHQLEGEILPEVHFKGSGFCYWSTQIIIMAGTDAEVRKEEYHQ